MLLIKKFSSHIDSSALNASNADLSKITEGPIDISTFLEPPLDQLRFVYISIIHVKMFSYDFL